ncbi:hypothetical protein CsSME_00048089 [Camellia sinensis var. sinensis]
MESIPYLLPNKIRTKDAGQQPFTFKIGQGSVIRGKDGMKAFWECRLEKLLRYGALLTMLMVLVDSQHGAFIPTRFWFLRLKL